MKTVVPVYINMAASVDAASLKEMNLASVIRNPNLLRRMCRLVRMGVAAGMMCLEDMDGEGLDAILTATSLGGLEDTGKFLAEITERSESGLNPTPFMRSVFNTVGSQIALLKGIKVYNMTYVHRGLSFESALSDAVLQIAEGKRSVLAGAFDEITPEAHILKERAGLFRHGEKEGEGASFFLIGNRPAGSRSVGLSGLDVRRGPLDERQKKEFAGDFLSGFGLDLSSVAVFNGARVKKSCGEYGTASARVLHEALASVHACSSEYLLVCNSFRNMSHSLILLKKTDAGL